MKETNRQDESLKKMSPSRKLEVSTLLYWSARQLKKAWLMSLHPDWSQKQLEEETKKAFLYART